MLNFFVLLRKIDCPIKTLVTNQLCLRTLSYRHSNWTGKEVKKWLPICGLFRSLFILYLDLVSHLQAWKTNMPEKYSNRLSLNAEVDLYRRTKRWVYKVWDSCQNIVSSFMPSFRILTWLAYHSSTEYSINYWLL